MSLFCITTAGSVENQAAMLVTAAHVHYLMLFFFFIQNTHETHCKTKCKIPAVLQRISHRKKRNSIHTLRMVYVKVHISYLHVDLIVLWLKGLRANFPGLDSITYWSYPMIQ